MGRRAAALAIAVIACLCVQAADAQTNPFNPPTPSGSQGFSTAIARDGSTYAVGWLSDHTSGRIDVYFNDAEGKGWSLQSSLSDASLAAGSGLGSSVALSANGNTLAASAPLTSGSGSVVIWTRSAATLAGTWTRQSTTLSNAQCTSVASGATFGSALALSDDGLTLAVGAAKDGSNKGSVCVLKWDGSSWVAQTTPALTGDASASAGLGYSVALSADGDTLAAGAYTDSSNDGAALIFTRSGSSWSQQGSKLVAAASAFKQGSSVALTSDGNMLAVGGPAATTGVWVYTRSGSAWSLLTSLPGSTVSLSTGSLFGSSVWFNSVGSVLMVGSPGDATGSAWFLTRRVNTFVQTYTKLSAGSGSLFGQKLAISGDASHIVIGALAAAAPVGYIFDLTPTVPEPPVVGTATRGNTQATVAFTAPTWDGGSAVTSFTVESSPGGFTATGAASPLTVTGLTNGQAYTFTVTATNAVGASSPSSASNSVTPA